MGYIFTCFGHENITSKHKTTLEFTKDKYLTLKGDCIVGIKSDYSLLELKKFIKSLKNDKKIIIKIEILNNDNKIIEKINAEVNPDFNSEKDIVIRKSDFIDNRTLAIKADKAACDLNMDFIENIKNNKRKIRIMIE